MELEAPPIPTSEHSHACTHTHAHHACTHTRMRIHACCSIHKPHWQEQAQDTGGASSDARAITAPSGNERRSLIANPPSPCRTGTRPPAPGKTAGHRGAADGRPSRSRRWRVPGVKAGSGSPRKGGGRGGGAGLSCPAVPIGMNQTGRKPTRTVAELSNARQHQKTSRLLREWSELDL